jgi:hypothetical protein
MSPLRLRSWVAAAAVVAAVGAGACNKTASPPGGFGVNITVDASGINATTRAKIKGATLSALSDKTGSAVVTSPIKEFATAVQGGTVRFHYTPADGVKAGERLTIGIDALGSGSVIIASGSKESPALKDMAAVDLTIKLEGPGDGGTPGDGGETDGGKKQKGTACVAGSECDTGICADHVCCDTKCDDVCAACNLPDTKGICTAYAVNTDPEMECAAKLPPPPPAEDDAGAAPATDGDAAVADASKPSSDGAAAEVAESDAAVLNAPDGGFMSMPNTCAGTCSGMKSCKFPGKTVSCGKPFCNTRRDVGAFQCDGNGGCNIELSPCADYACDPESGACKSQCGGNPDCLGGTKYCNGTTNMCAPKKDNGISCNNGGECSSGNCVDKVCCNTAACDASQGLSCATGKCVCPGVSCAAGVACQVYFQDLDGDKFGNKAGTIAAGTAKAGCAGAPPAGFVADNTDCDDGDAKVFPGQTEFSPTASKGIGTFDFNCDGSETKETPEFPGGTCKFCGGVGSCDTTSTTCSTANQSSSFVCPQETPEFTRVSESVTLPMSIDLAVGRAIGAAAAAPGGTIPPGEVIDPVKPPICQVCVLQCCGCRAADKNGFLAAVKCGVTATPYSCGACAAVGGAAPRTAGVAKVQRCR